MNAIKGLHWLESGYSLMLVAILKYWIYMVVLVVIGVSTQRFGGEKYSVMQSVRFSGNSVVIANYGFKLIYNY